MTPWNFSCTSHSRKVVLLGRTQQILTFWGSKNCFQASCNLLKKNVTIDMPENDFIAALFVKTFANCNHPGAGKSVFETG